MSEIVNHLLDLKEPQPFDFSINDRLLRQPLNKFISSNRLSTEEVISIEFFPAVYFADDGNIVDLPSWIGSIDAKFGNFIFAGCFDGSVQLINKFDMTVTGAAHTHEMPVRDIHCWKSPLSSYILATASKDHSIKCWSTSSIDEIGNGEDFQLSQVATCNGHQSSVEALTSSADDRFLFSCDWNGVIMLWNIAELSSHSIVQRLEKPKKRKRKADIEHESDSAVALELAPISRIKAHNQCISSLQLSEVDGGRLYSSSWDHSFREWDIERQECVATFAGSKVSYFDYRSLRTQALWCRLVRYVHSYL